MQPRRIPSREFIAGLHTARDHVAGLDPAVVDTGGIAVVVGALDGLIDSVGRAAGAVLDSLEGQQDAGRR